MRAPVDVHALADLRGVVRIAKSASIGVTGNTSRIERAEAAIAAVAEMIEALQNLVAESIHPYDGSDYEYGEWAALDAARSALERLGGAK